MDVTRDILQLGVAVLLVGAAASTPASAQTTTTECVKQGAVVRCTSKDSNPPLDYAGILNAGANLVPPVERRAQEKTELEEPPVPSTVREAGSAVMLETGNDLLTVCRGDLLNILTCTVFLQGVYRGFMGGVAFSKANPIICVPEGANGKQMRDIVVKYVTEHPETRHQTADLLTIKALNSAFPCT